jgi:translation initiation factor IF-3
LIGADGAQLGVVSLQDALNRSREIGLDLVEVSSQAVPPVCRIMDFGKFKFEKAKREKEAKKKQKVIKVKEIKMGPNISEHDYQFKFRHAKDFIAEGDKVRLAVVFHGRQITHQELGRKVMARFIEDMKGLAIPEQFPRMEGKEFAAMFTIDPLVKQKIKKDAAKATLSPKPPKTAIAEPKPNGTKVPAPESIPADSDKPSPEEPKVSASPEPDTNPSSVE